MSDSSSPLVSIVTPSYNQARYLEYTIRSVLEQDYPNIEYIIVDGGSNDGSAEIIRRYSDRFAWWVSEKDHGQTEAINKGFAHARGEILAWLNSDDTYEISAVREAVAFLREQPQVGLVYGDANFIDENGRLIGRFPAAQTDYHRLQAWLCSHSSAISFLACRPMAQGWSARPFILLCHGLRSMGAIGSPGPCSLFATPMG